MILNHLGIFYVQRIRATVNSTEQKRLLMDLDVSMRVSDCPYTVHFYGALFREVSLPLTIAFNNSFYYF